ncbi:hypothetical protein GCM10027615_68070 [Plantactinospora veratri]
MLVHGLRAAQVPRRVPGEDDRRVPAEAPGNRSVGGRRRSRYGGGRPARVGEQATTREDSMSSEIMDAEPDRPDQAAVESERGALVAVLVMVLLGVAGIFAVST